MRAILEKMTELADNQIDLESFDSKFDIVVNSIKGNLQQIQWLNEKTQLLHDDTETSSYEKYEVYIRIFNRLLSPFCLNYDAIIIHTHTKQWLQLMSDLTPTFEPSFSLCKYAYYKEVFKEKNTGFKTLFIDPVAEPFTATEACPLNVMEYDLDLVAETIVDMARAVQFPSPSFDKDPVKMWSDETVKEFFFNILSPQNNVWFSSYLFNEPTTFIVEFMYNSPEFEDKRLLLDSAYRYMTTMLEYVQIIPTTKNDYRSRLNIWDAAHGLASYYDVSDWDLNFAQHVAHFLILRNLNRTSAIEYARTLLDLDMCLVPLSNSRSYRDRHRLGFDNLHFVANQLLRHRGYEPNPHA